MLDEADKADLQLSTYRSKIDSDPRSIKEHHIAQHHVEEVCWISECCWFVSIEELSSSKSKAFAMHQKWCSRVNDTTPRAVFLTNHSTSMMLLEQMIPCHIFPMDQSLLLCTDWTLCNSTIINSIGNKRIKTQGLLRIKRYIYIKNPYQYYCSKDFGFNYSWWRKNFPFE